VSWVDRRDIPDVILTSPPLIEVICQVRFPTVLRLQHDASLVAQVQDSLRKEYPVMEAGAVLALSVPGDPQDAPQAVLTGRSWRFTDPSQGTAVAVASDFVALSSTSYVHWEDFSVRLERVLAVVFETAAISSATRLGLRYTNVVPLPEDEAMWRSTIESELLGWVADVGAGRTLTSSLQEVRLTTEVCDVGMRHGVLPVEPGQTRRYLLDIDCYADGPLDADARGLTSGATALNGVANRIFFNAIAPEGLVMFGPRPKERSGDGNGTEQGGDT
jgi:uncharacterized protein (TIGR04255 family)